jgi:hypothetical protein
VSGVRGIGSDRLVANDQVGAAPGIRSIVPGCAFRDHSPFGCGSLAFPATRHGLAEPVSERLTFADPTEGRESLGRLSQSLNPSWPCPGSLAIPTRGLVSTSQCTSVSKAAVRVPGRKPAVSRLQTPLDCF